MEIPGNPLKFGRVLRKLSRNSVLPGLASRRLGKGSPADFRNGLPAPSSELGHLNGVMLFFTGVGRSRNVVAKTDAYINGTLA